MREIQARAFENCRRLRALTFEKGSQLRVIAQAVFSGCRNLKQIDLPESLEIIGSDDRGKDGQLYPGPFCGSGITQVAVPAGVREIKEEAFQGCECLKCIRFTTGAQLQRLWPRAFRWMSEESLDRPIVFKKDNRTGDYVCGEPRIIVLNDGLEKIEAKCLKDSKAQLLVIPAGVREIEPMAFKSCEKLESVIFRNKGKLR